MLLDLLYFYQKYDCGPQAGTRLVALAGSGTAGCLIKAKGSGVTVADALVAYSGLGSATAYEHLLANPIPFVMPTADVGGRKKRKKRDDLERYRENLRLLREHIERVIDPLKYQKAPVVVAPDGDDVEILAPTGSTVSIETPELVSRAEVMRMVANALEGARVDAMKVRRERDAAKALAIAKAELARIKKRQRDDELMMML